MLIDSRTLQMGGQGPSTCCGSGFYFGGVFFSCAEGPTKSRGVSAIIPRDLQDWDKVFKIFKFFRNQLQLLLLYLINIVFFFFN